MMLVLRVAQTAADQPLTIVELAARFPGRSVSASPSSVPWYAREPFASEETCRPGWALVDKGLSSRTRNLSYAEQDEELRNRGRLLGLSLRRRSAVEIVYDTLLYAAVQGERLLATEWDWSSSGTSDGGFVAAGQFDEQGLHLLAYSQAVRFGSLGVCATVRRGSTAPMYLVTTNRAGYVLFSTSPSGRVAVGLTEDQRRVRLLLRGTADWATVREWPVEEYSHTDLMLALGKVDEPQDPQDILKLLPVPSALH
jgi:hypothetical protein